MLQTGVYTSTYLYDDANRLTHVNGITYTWDANGNLLSDGFSTYTYTHANRLSAVSDPSSISEYSYNGLGDRVSQTVDGNTTNYAIDIAAGLTQVLADNEYTYLYGMSRIGQQITTMEYFLGDALGSVRQLVDAEGEVSLAQSFKPYGETLSSSGEGATSYGFAGEWTDGYITDGLASQGLIYLRSRYYDPATGRFLTRDTWQGDYTRPFSLHRWVYGFANPIKFIDPTGHYNRQAAVRFAVTHDLNDPMDGVFDAPGSDCASFVSSALWSGRITDPRLDQDGNTWKFDKQENRWKIALWSGEIMLGKDPFFYHKDTYLYEWFQTDQLLDFLVSTEIGSEFEYTGYEIPHFRHDIQGGNRNNPAWLNYLETNKYRIQPGDLVFYRMKIRLYPEFDWDHVAMIIKWRSQTYVGEDGKDPWAFGAYMASRGLPHDISLGCDPQFDHHEIKPHVVERGGLLQYFYSRSIDNTYGEVAKVKIVHIR